MSIYRGPGGAGDAVNDSSSEATITVQAKDAALVAQAAAETAATNAATSATSAASSATSAAAASTASINMANGFNVSVTGLSAGSSPTSTYTNSTYSLALGIPAGTNGTNGTNGTDGRTILNGSTNPTTQGANGDFYINTATNTLFGPKASGAWGSGTSLVGPTGETGATGATGSTGATGNGIASITLTSGTHAPGTTDTYTITYTSGGTSTFTVYNGANGTGAVSSVTATAPITSSGGSAPNIAMAAATTSVNGYLTSTDWTTFNNKQAALTSGTNIKTLNSVSLLGSGNITFSNISPITTTGDLIIGNGANSATRLPIGTSGYLLTSNGTTASWAAAPVSLPSQTGNSGKFLKTDGTTASWNVLPTVLNVLNRSASTIAVSVANGALAVLNRAGSTINVAVS